MERSHNYPPKNRGRDEWMSFLPSSFMIPSETSGLYLPGVENLELPGYLKKGCRPELLIGAEHDEERFPLVQANARGIRLTRTIREAVEFIEGERLPLLTFANLDFDGSYDTFIPSLLSLFRVFPNHRGGFFAVTSYAARDAQALRQGACNVSKFYSGLVDRLTFHTEFGRMLERHEALRLGLGARMEPHTHLARELGFLWWMTLAMGVTVRDERGGGQYDRKFMNSVTKVLRRITKLVEGVTQNAADLHFVREPELYELLQGRRSHLWPTDFRHLAYYTACRQPMRTWMLRIIPVTDVADTAPPTVQEVLAQMWELAARAPLRYIDESGNTKVF